MRTGVDITALETFNEPLRTILAKAKGLNLNQAFLETYVFENVNGTYEATPTNKTADGRIGYPNKQMVNVLSKGVIYVYATETIAVGDAIRLFHTDDASAATNKKYKGRFGKTAVAGKTFQVTAGARWLKAATAGNIALLEIDIPTLTVSADTQ